MRRRRRWLGVSGSHQAHGDEMDLGKIPGCARFRTSLEQDRTSPSHRRYADRLREPDPTTLRYLQIGPEVEKVGSSQFAVLSFLNQEKYRAVASTNFLDRCAPRASTIFLVSTIFLNWHISSTLFYLTSAQPLRPFCCFLRLAARTQDHS